jgi:predicted Rossmann fold flavoprotein
MVILKKRISHNPDLTYEEMLIGLLNHKLNYILIKEAGSDPTMKVSHVAEKELIALIRQMKEFKLVINATNSFEQAQVCAGGVSTGQINPDSMESLLHKGLYFAGELVDVDGTCGGYNLQWAWSSGFVAGTAAGKKK